MGASQSGCQGAETESSGCPVMHKAAAAPAGADTGGSCPMRGSPGGPARSSSDMLVAAASTASKGKVYNVRGEEIDPSNRMPFNPNQERHPDQKLELSTDRVKSSIPKGGTDGETWTYPSPQMFYNALKRKGKGGDADESEMATVIAVHNNMNERTWATLMEWERRNHPDASPKLRRFVGKPDDLTPKAWLLSKLGLRPHPFDRHDWTIDRGDGEEVRYVLDYYYDEEAGALDEKPALHDVEAVRSISFDVRPALDSPGAMFDRLKQIFDADLNAGAAAPPKSVLAQPAENPAAPNGVQVNMSFEDATRRVDESCKGCRAALEACDSEQKCGVASIALQVCMGKVLCPQEAERFSTVATEENYDAMAACMDNYRTGVLQFMAKQQEAAVAAAPGGGGGGAGKRT